MRPLSTPPFSCRAKPTSSPSSDRATASASWAASWAWISGRLPRAHRRFAQEGRSGNRPPGRSAQRDWRRARRRRGAAGAPAGAGKELKRISQQRQTQETAVKSVREIAAALERQAKLVETLRKQLEAAQGRLAETGVALKSPASRSGRLMPRSAPGRARSSRRTLLTRPPSRSWSAGKESPSNSASRKNGARRRGQQLSSAQARLAQEQQMLAQQGSQVAAARQEIDRLQGERDNYPWQLWQLWKPRLGQRQAAGPDPAEGAPGAGGARARKIRA